MRQSHRPTFKKSPAFLFLLVAAATALAASLTLGACGHATEAQAPKSPISVSPDHPELLVQKFPATDITFQETQLFLWKKDFTPAQVARVLQQTTLFDEAKDRLFLLGKTRAERKAKFTAIGVDVVDLAPQLEDLDSKRQDLKDANEQLASENRKPEAERDAKLIARLTKKRDRLDNQIKPVDAALTKVKAARLETELSDWNKLETDLADRRVVASDTLKPIDETVWIFNSSPIVVEFKFPGAGRTETYAAIRNWDLNRINDPELVSVNAAPVSDFSTDGKTIGKVTYEEEGGVFTFEVYAPTATYYFKIARANYQAIDGRIHYKGDIVRCSVAGGDGKPVIEHVRDFVQCGVQGAGTPVLRRGAANLADLDVKD
jgi:hypothetical protein